MSARVACRADCTAGKATFMTVASMNAMLEPRMVAARIHGPSAVTGRWHEPARIAASSQGGLAKAISPFSVRLGVPVFPRNSSGAMHGLPRRRSGHYHWDPEGAESGL